MVHLHLEHRVVQRLLARFSCTGIRPSRPLARVPCAIARRRYRASILIGRLALYGRRAERLHEEIIPLAARWVAPSQRDGGLSAYGRDAEAKTIDLLDESLTSQSAEAPSKEIQEQLLEAAPQDIQELLPHLEPRADEIAETAIEKLRTRGERERR